MNDKNIEKSGVMEAPAVQRAPTALAMAPSGPVPLGGFLRKGSLRRCSVSCVMARLICGFLRCRPGIPI